MHVEMPAAYFELTTFAENHASIFLEKFGHLLTWNSAEKEVLADIGCANGVITTDILLPLFQAKTQEIIGIDVSSKMIQLANELNKKPNVSFLEMDVAKKDIDDNLVEKFHHIFSFYSLHMIADQKQCAENLYKMLKPGGEAFITCVVRNNFMSAWFGICDWCKWSEYLKPFPKKFSHYQICDQPQEEFDRIFTDAGFVVESYYEPIMHWFAGREEYERYVIELNYLSDMIPESLKEEFSKDLLAMTYHRNGDEYNMGMDVLVGIVKKPLN